MMSFSILIEMPINPNQINFQKLNIVVITMGLSPIVKPLVDSYHGVKGIIECAPRQKTSHTTATVRQSILSVAKLAQNRSRLSKYAKKAKIPYFYMDHSRNSNLETFIRRQNPDLIVIYSMSKLLKENIFSIPRLGAINLHPSRLPDYRGPNPWFWISYNMEERGGVTVHYIDKGEDTGDIILQETFEIPLGIEFKSLQKLTIEKHGVKILLKAIDLLATGNAQRHPQSIKSPTDRAREVSKEEYPNMIDWHNWKIERLWHILRSTQFSLDAILQYQKTINPWHWSAKTFKKCDTGSYSPGKIYKKHGKHFIACKEGKIFLEARFSIAQAIKCVTT